MIIYRQIRKTPYRGLAAKINSYCKLVAWVI